MQISSTSRSCRLPKKFSPYDWSTSLQAILRSTIFLVWWAYLIDSLDFCVKIQLVNSGMQCRLSVSGSTNSPMPNRHRSDRTTAFEISSTRTSLCFGLNSIGREGSRLWLSLTNLPHWRGKEPRSEKNGGGIPNSYRSMLLYALSLLHVVLSFSLFAILLRRLRQREKMAMKNVKFDQPDIGEPPMSDRIFSSMRTEPP